MGITKQEAKSFTIAVIGQLFNHGWAEDYQGHMDYNDVSELFDLILDDGDINKFIDRTEWDEEGDWSYDDGGISSFAMEVTKLMRKHNILTGEKLKPREARINRSIKLSFMCPHCKTHNNYDGEMLSVDCKKCENPVTIK